MKGNIFIGFLAGESVAGGSAAGGITTGESATREFGSAGQDLERESSAGCAC